MFSKMPFVLIAVVLAVVFLDPFISLTLKQTLYALSLTIKEIIVALLPFIIFGLLFKASVTLASGATRIIGLILVLVCISNFVSTFLSHSVGSWIYHFDLSMIKPKEFQGLQPLWTLTLPKLIPNAGAMFAGIILGILASIFCPQPAQKIALKIDKWVGGLLKSFVYLIPFFVTGFVINLQYDGVVATIAKDYTSIVGVIALACFSYIFLVYFLLSSGKIKTFANCIKNMLPAAISGFSTMSSAASMPLTIIGVENSVKNKDLSRSVVPATVNIHLVGDCFAIPIFAYAVLKSFGMNEPSLLSYLTFSLYFVMAKFSVAAIPGGGILVMLPILESHLGFNAEMMSMITALYVLFDPVITCANVFGNGAFAKLIDNIAAKIGMK